MSSSIGAISNVMYAVHDIPMSEIFSDSEFNCRGMIVPFDVMDLVPDIKLRGLDYPITVRPYDEKPGKKYRIVTGHRRFMAFRVLEKETIPCRIRTDLKPFEENIMNLTENIKRADLNILQEARGLAAFKKAKWTEPVIAAQVGVSRGWVQVRLMLLDLPEDVQSEAAAGLLNQEQIRQLYTVRSDKDKMYAMIRLIKERRINGESTKITIQKTPNPYRKVRREDQEIYDFQATVQKAVGNNFATICLGWAAGANNDYEVYRALQDEAKRLGKNFEIPKELTDKLG